MFDAAIFPTFSTEFVAVESCKRERFARIRCVFGEKVATNPRLVIFARAHKTILFAFESTSNVINSSEPVESLFAINRRLHIYWERRILICVRIRPCTLIGILATGSTNLFAQHCLAKIYKITRNSQFVNAKMYTARID